MANNMGSVPLYQRSVAPGSNVYDIKPALGGINNLNQLTEMSKALGDHLRVAAENIFNLDFEKNIRQTMGQIYESNKDNPEEFKKQSDEFWDGAKEEIPFHLLTKSDATFSAISQNYFAQSKKNFEDKLNTNLQLSAFQSQEQIINDIAKDSANLMVYDSVSPDASQSLQAAASFESVAQHMESLSRTMSLPGVDGRPLFSAEAQFRFLGRAKEKMGMSAATAWMDAQPDKVTAYKAWKEGRVSLRYNDPKTGKVESQSVRNNFSSDVLEKIDKDFLHDAKSQLSEFRQSQVFEEKQRKEEQKRYATNLYAKAQDGQLTVAEVDESKDELTPKDYTTLRKMAQEVERGVDIKTDLNTYIGLTRKIDVDKQDISPEIMHAVEQGLLSRTDASTLLNRNNGVTEDAVKTGRHHLIGLIGVNKMISNETQTATAANAEKYYFDRIKRYSEENQGRQPNEEETIKMAEEVSEKFTLVPIESRLKTFPKPKHIPDSWKFKTKDINQQDLELYMGETVADYVEKYRPTPKGEPKRTLDQAMILFDTDTSLKQAIERDRDYLSDNKYFDYCREAIKNREFKLAQKAEKERVK